MKVCSWGTGCAQETSSDIDLCEYHEKLSGGLLVDSGEADKAATRRVLKRQQQALERRERRRGPRG